jgi:hypothetical protein
LNAQQGTLTESIRKALRNVEEEILNTEPGRGNLGKKRRHKMRGGNPGNILEEKRPRANPDWPNSMVVYEKEELPVIPGKQALTGLQPLDRVKILTSRYGRVYAKDKPKYTEGIVRKRVGQMVDVLCTVYGIPDAEQAFSIFMLSLHIKNVGWYRAISIPVYTTR